MARDWRWRQASFDGVRFYVDGTDIGQIGRHVVTHEYPGAEQHDNEDLGRPARQITVVAYFASETADADSAALIDRIAQEGPGLLDIPMFGRMMARATPSRASWSHERLNYVGFPVNFVEETGTDLIDPVSYGAALIGLMLGDLPGLAAGFIADALAGLADIAWPVADMAAGLADIAADVGGLVDVAAAGLAPDILAALEAAAPVLSVGAMADLPVVAQTLFEQVDAIASGPETTTAGPSAPVVAAALADASGAALARRQTMLAAWDVSPVAAVAPLAAAAVYAAEAARALAAATYTDRAAATAARAQVAALADSILPLLTHGALADAFASAIGVAAQQITRAMLDLAPVVIVETGQSLPANVLAWKLYGDLSRSLELVDRNRVACPCFMPTQIEAAGA